MKKILLLMLMLQAVTMHSQILLNRNYNALVVGNIASDITGATSGQGAMFAEYSNGVAPTTSSNAAATNGQVIINDVAHANVLQFIGPNGDKGTRFIWEDGLSAAWSGRNSTNNIVEIEVELFTGAGGITSRNTVGLSLYGNAYSIVPVGFSFNPSTLVLSGTAYYATDINTVATYGNYTINLGTTAVPYTLPANTWVKIGMSYNTVTRAIIWKSNTGLNATFTGVQQRVVSPDSTVSYVAISPLELDYVLFSGSLPASVGPPAVTAIPNTSAATILFDNLLVRASATNTLLGVEKSLVSNKFSISPNPTSDFVNISSAENIGVNGVSIADINGRIVKEMSYKNMTDVQVSLSDLAAGMYIMNIKSEQGTATKKILKN